MRLPVALAGLFSAAAALLLFVPRLHPGIPAGDSSELIAAARTLGTAHPPGYPLWTLLAAAWGALVPLGSYAFRLNLFSAVTAALTCILQTGSVGMAPALLSWTRVGDRFPRPADLVRRMRERHTVEPCDGCGNAPR